MKRISIIAWLMIPVVVYSQYNTDVGKAKRMIRASLIYQSYTIENVDNAITETTGPIEILWPINSNLTLQLLNTPGLSSFGDYALNGLSDTFLKANYTFLDNKALIGVGIGIPTGEIQLDPNEFVMSQILSNNAFAFRLPVFGQGFTGSFGAGYVQPLSNNVVMGVGVNYVYRGIYKPTENSWGDYDPGDQIGTNIGMDLALSDMAKISLDVIYNYFMSDKIRGRETFGSGAKISAAMSFIMQTEKWSLWANAILRQKGKNENWKGISLEPEAKNSNGPQFELTGIGRFPMNELMGLRAHLIIRAYGENEYRRNDAAVFGIGGGVDYALSRAMIIICDLKGYFGRLGGGTTAQSLSGFEVGVGTSYHF